MIKRQIELGIWPTTQPQFDAIWSAWYSYLPLRLELVHNDTNTKPAKFGILINSTKNRKHTLYLYYDNNKNSNKNFVS